jgi:MarR family transcriptional regulator, organic hydroperoxide resistance regulator
LNQTSCKTPNPLRPRGTGRRRSQASVLPPTATHPALLDGKSDRAFRKFVSDFFTVANRIEATRRYLGARIGVSGPQYSMMMAIAELEGSAGVSVGRVAEFLHVAPTFVTAESGKLHRLGLIGKGPDAADRRVARLRISRKGRTALGSMVPFLRQVNDMFFDLESPAQFATLCRALARLVETSGRAIALAADTSPNGRPAR